VALRRALAALGLTLALAGCATLFGARGLGAARPGESTFHTLHVGGRERSFVLHLPPDTSARRAAVTATQRARSKRSTSTWRPAR